MHHIETAILKLSVNLINMTKGGKFTRQFLIYFNN